MIPKSILWVIGVQLAIFPAAVDGLLQPLPMPDIMSDCIKYRTQAVNVTEVPAQLIGGYCLSRFLYKTVQLRPERPIANETILYAQELFRMMMSEHEQRRQKRQATPPRIRREVRVMSRGEWNTFIAAVQRLKAEFVAPGLTRWDSLADVHRSVVASAHDGPNFLGWHRIFLLVVEFALGPGIGIPYWDSTLDFNMAQPVDSVLWTDQFFGDGFGPVMNGPFGGWITPEGVPLTRNIGNAGILMNNEAIQRVISQMNHDQITEPSTNPANSLEVHHNGPHVWVDGQLSALATAAQDPVFYMHHSFVDYIWSLFRSNVRQNGGNPDTDYPFKGSFQHAPNYPMLPFTGLLNIYGYHSYYEQFTQYEPAPSCPACGGSMFLTCVMGMCRSNVGVVPVAAPAFAGAAGPGAPFVAAPASAGGPARASMGAAQTGPLPIGRKFQTPFNDPRTRSDTLPSGAATRVRRSVGPINSTVPDQQSTRTGNAQIDHGYTNTFVLNGVSDIKLWAFIPVRIIFERPPEMSIDRSGSLNVLLNKKDRFLTSATYPKCHVSGSGAAKIFVQSDGIDYSGRYKDYAVVDERQSVTSSMTYVGVKNPESGSAQLILTAYDLCGRVCTPHCLSNGEYKPCSGTFYIDSKTPQQYSATREEALENVWRLGEEILPEANSKNIPVSFVCQFDASWPWVLNQ